MKRLDSALVLGGLGQAGALMAETLSASGVAVTCVDRRDRPTVVPPNRYLQADITQPSPELLRKIAATSCVIVCLPEETAMCAAPAILGAMRDGALWVDTLSVKTGICCLLRDDQRKLEILSINPMFAPSLGWNGRPVAVVEVAPGENSRAFQEILRSAGAMLETVTAEQHDCLTAMVQVATHAATLAFGLTLSSLGYDIEQAWKLATPPHRLFLALLTRIVSADPEVYFDIQHHHPQAERVREALQEAMTSLDTACTSPGQFTHIIEQLRTLLAPKRPMLEAFSDRLISLAGTEPHA